MTAIVREALVIAVQTRLAAISGVTVELMPSAESDVTPRLAIDDQGQSVIDGDPFNTRYAMRLSIEGVVEADPTASDHGRDAWSKLNALYASVVRALMAGGQNMGGICEAVTEGDFSTDVSMLASDRTLAFTLGIEIQFTNRSTDPALS